ncbi:MAG: hypothetical protein AUI36_14990 [Cyanobacteria bacterium 13_1_40CM_2_61_4]|nr:MAG: hypothetical protein AUI36_14990 [Cyanobacteria bacterium 13_1_40CM_2_61_4]
MRLGTSLLGLSGALGALWIAVIGCGEDRFAPTLMPTPLLTDDTAYVAFPSGVGQDRRYGFTVVAHYENRTTAPLYLDRCSSNSPSPIYGVQVVDGAGTAAYDPIWACGAGSPILVEAGATRSDTLRIAGPNMWDGTGAPVGTLEGEFRLYYEVRTCANDVQCRSSVAPSNPFRVQLAR